jgi:glycine C-acetyltransferase
MITATSIAIFDLLGENKEALTTLRENTTYFREKMTAAGFDIRKGTHPICPVMLYDAGLAQNMAKELLAEGIYVIGFFYPVVPQGKARIRVQISAAHTKAHLDKAIEAFIKVGKKLGAIK